MQCITVIGLFYSSICLILTFINPDGIEAQLVKINEGLLYLDSLLDYNLFIYFCNIGMNVQLIKILGDNKMRLTKSL